MILDETTTRRMLGWLMHQTGRTELDICEELYLNEIKDFDVHLMQNATSRTLKVTAVENNPTRKYSHMNWWCDTGGRITYGKPEETPSLKHYSGSAPPKPLPGTIHGVAVPLFATEDLKSILDYGLMSIEELEKHLVKKVELPLKKTVIESPEEVENFRDIEIILED